VLSKVGCGRRLGPQILLGLAGHVLAVDQVADASEDGKQQQLLHGDLRSLQWRSHSALYSRVGANGVPVRTQRPSQ